MVHRFSVLLLLLVCTTAIAQTPDQPDPKVPKSFHDSALNVTYFYPGRFVPDPASSTPKLSDDPTPKCAHSTLFANSVTPVDTSSFVLSTIDNTCPKVLRGATLLGPFVREQILRQLKQYGQPTITQEPTNYSIDGHPAAIVLASVPMPEVKGKIPTTTYAAKACVLGNVPVKPRKKSEQVEPTRHVLCFDFTTLHSDLYTLMFAFSMQFDNDQPQPMVPGSVIR
ncbi:MAG TPA: hypothetical protein VHW70_10510 [Edaphobacter sp.]|jgi:hypothetical protein|nr:hypothetical protein [Edaphobacter sp.]